MRSYLQLCGLAIASPSIAAAEPSAAETSLHSSVGWGATIVPERVALTTEAGYNGGAARAEATGSVEVAILPRFSVFTAVTYGAETVGASRPSLGLAVQVADPRTRTIGARVSVAYKPEGFTEPEGELEAIAMFSHMLDRDVARMFIAYGRDPEGRESDGEAGAGYLHSIADHLVVGATTRYRYAIETKGLGPRWDLVAGAVGELVVERWRFELLLGGDANRTTRVASGLLALFSVGLDL